MALSPRSRQFLRLGLPAAVLFAGIVIAAMTRPRGPAKVSETRSLMGTYITLTVVGRDETAAREALEAGFARIEQLNQVLSSHSSQSELSKALAAAQQGPVRVSDDLYRAIRTGVEWHGRSGGAFDITVKPLLDLWRKAGKENRVPTGEDLAAARERLGADRLKLDDAARTVQAPDGVEIDLGGLGKGFAAEAVTNLLRARGVTQALVAVAGDIHALGGRPEGGPWRVGVQDPREPDNPRALLAVLHLRDRAVSTSGNYQRYATIQGRRYSHIVDPRTGHTADNVPSVTVVGPETLTTDILGTALSVLGVEEGLRLVESMPGIEAMFITFDERDQPRFVRSSGFAKYEAAPEGETDYRK